MANGKRIQISVNILPKSEGEMSVACCLILDAEVWCEFCLAT